MGGYKLVSLLSVLFFIRYGFESSISAPSTIRIYLNNLPAAAIHELIFLRLWALD
jgi:hypothetical protein